MELMFIVGAHYRTPTLTLLSRKTSPRTVASEPMRSKGLKLSFAAQIMLCGHLFITESKERTNSCERTTCHFWQQHTKTSAHNSLRRLAPVWLFVEAVPSRAMLVETEDIRCKSTNNHESSVIIVITCKLPWQYNSRCGGWVVVIPAKMWP